jgi:hypothetical protein
MPRKTKQPILYLALSPAALATAMTIPARKIYEAILAGHLPVFQKGMHRRIWIGDAEKWFRTHWQPPKPGRIKKETAI